ncbi:uncharacterized protein RCC_00091 [Ramularia collo-cygni]|uniref:Uncharacterized protein n=1 Tax=Ramularia collo-cygni TaxID=112498 RepID=A0A2D3UMN4_9PEZI|nr:uncharacterized protein RCC_00091 [Ramularia collo-cygni]CZT14118.1 uncharacterized protein RCC_00091 [Ramularia collo-cygni]
MDFVSNWVTDKVAGFAKTGIEAGGTLAGNAVGGVGTLLENSGRAVGQSIAGAIGSVGGYINNYGQQVQNSMAADGPVSGGSQKKTAVKGTSASASRALSATPGTTRPLPSTRANALQKPVSSSTSSYPARPPPPRIARNLPSKKPSPPEPTAKAYPTRPPVSTSQSARTIDGRVRPSPASRARPPKPTATTANKKRFDNSKRPSISTSQSERTADGKVKISAASRPRPVKA